MSGHLAGAIPVLLAIACTAGCAGPDLRDDTQRFHFTLGPRPCSVDVAASRVAVRDNIQFRRPPGPGEAMLLLYPTPRAVRWNSRNVDVPVEGAFLDRTGRVVGSFRAVPLSRVDHVSGKGVRALLLGGEGFLRNAELSEGSQLAIPGEVWAYARENWTRDAQERRKQWDAMGYRPPAERWGERAKPGPSQVPVTTQP